MNPQSLPLWRPDISTLSTRPTIQRTKVQDCFLSAHTEIYLRFRFPRVGCVQIRSGTSYIGKSSDFLGFHDYTQGKFIFHKSEHWDSCICCYPPFDKATVCLPEINWIASHPQTNIFIIYPFPGCEYTVSLTQILWSLSSFFYAQSTDNMGGKFYWETCKGFPSNITSQTLPSNIRPSPDSTEWVCIFPHRQLPAMLTSDQILSRAQV